ncbi:uncharacterized protein [Pseudorasbora parva]|uniref:uncharacterized protein n=1 Tax=Pseudorasbora parva TaxID=51549 RepID=UPI00351EB2BD
MQSHMIETHGQLPTKSIREQYALGIVKLFPSLRDPYSKKGYEHFYDGASNTGYIAWRLKTVHRKIRQGSLPPVSPLYVSPGGPKCQRATYFEDQLDGVLAKKPCLLNHTTDKSIIFQKMRQTFQYRQNLVRDPGTSVDILSTFPRFLEGWWIKTSLSCLMRKYPPGCFKSGTSSSDQILRPGNVIPSVITTSPFTTTRRTEVSKNQCMGCC